ncbi:MAG TPA: hypothetical protein VET85_16240, partial [Stellaceae bacterium]|nr:hypothetical protein [Stellaceae bacterium]
MRPLILLACALLLGACNTTWTKPGSTPAEFDAAITACSTDTPPASAHAALDSAGPRDNFVARPDRVVDPDADARYAAFEGCMNARGFTKQPQAAAAAAPPAPAKAAAPQPKPAPGQRAGDECDALLGAKKYVKGGLSRDYLACFDTRYD